MCREPRSTAPSVGVYMSKEQDKPKKERTNKHEEKVSFDGTFEDLIKISTTGAGAKKAGVKKAAKEDGNE